jgi:aminoglycoside phosphotransferase (APT) family kinase protein
LAGRFNTPAPADVMPGHIVAGLAGTDLAALNAPSEEEYLALYADRAGISDTSDCDFFIASSFFRVSAIIHDIKGRLVRGTAEAADRLKTLPELTALTWQQARLAGTQTC